MSASNSVRTVILSPRFLRIDASYADAARDFGKLGARPGPRPFAANKHFENVTSIAFGEVDAKLKSCTFQGSQVALLDDQGGTCSFDDSTHLIMHCDKTILYRVPECRLEPSLIRRHLMYSDILIWPRAACGTAFGVPYSDLDFLIDIGVMQRPEIDVSDTDYLGNKFFLLQTRCFEASRACALVPALSRRVVLRRLTFHHIVPTTTVQ